jgi:endonuclease/exonuclease/phosphatase family metal-dependent hydrolase
MTTSEPTTRIAVHNIAGGITGSDERVRTIVEEIDQRRPTSLFLPEAYNAEVPNAQNRVENFAEDMARLGYAVGYAIYDGEAGGCMALAQKDLAIESNQQPEDGPGRVRGDWEYFTLVTLAGRGAIEMSLWDVQSERMVIELGLHANTLRKERSDEIGAFLTEYVGVLATRKPLVLAGDLNTMGEKNIKTWLYTIMGQATEAGYNTLVKASGDKIPPADYRSSFLPSRLASIPIRVGEYAQGREYKQLVDAGFIDIAPEGPSTSFPGMRASEFVLWLSGVQADHIMCAPEDQFVVIRQTRYPQAKGDDHNWVETGFCLVPAQYA